MEKTTDTYYRNVLVEELAKRVEANPRYSLRRYAQFLGVAPGALSQIMRGERSPSDRVVERLFSRLELNAEQRRAFLGSLLEEKRSNGLRRISRRLKAEAASRFEPSGTSAGSAIVDVGIDQFRIISDWYHYAILEMVERADFRPSPAWIAGRLGISSVEAKLGFERLQKLELIEPAGKKWRKTNVRIQTKDPSKTSEFHRRRQRQIVEKAREALDVVPWESRHHSAITISIDPARIPEARDRIQKVLWDLAAELERGVPTTVYEIALQIFPLERNPK